MVAHLSTIIITLIFTDEKSWNNDILNFKPKAEEDLNSVTLALAGND